jgi:exosortase B
LAAVLETKPSQGTAGLEWLPVAAGLLVLYVPSFYDLATTLWQIDDYAHGPIILVVIAWLIWDRRQALFAAPARTAPLPGFALLLFGLLIYALGRSQDIILFEVGSLAPILAGVLLATRGWPGLGAFWFSILFIAFLVPLPGFFVDALTGPLKQNVSAVAEQLLYAAAYPIARNGVVLTIGQYQLLVADACSGLNSMFSLSALGALYLYLMRYRSWLHNGLVLASILPIAFCANIVRVMFLVLVTYHFGDAAGQGFVHNFSGMSLFIIALLGLFAFDALLRVAGAFFGRERKA